MIKSGAKLYRKVDLRPLLNSRFVSLPPPAGYKAYNLPSDQQQIMTELHSGGPVEAAFTVYEDFLLYKSGQNTHALIFHSHLHRATQHDLLSSLRCLPARDRL